MQKIRRIVAFLSVAVIFFLIIGTLICGITGSQYFFGMFFLMLAVPVVLWVFMWFTRLVNREEMEAADDAKDINNRNEIKKGTEPEVSDSEKIGEDKV